jgi:sulfoxide reductase heme-binding subunit YedZ
MTDPALWYTARAAGTTLLPVLTLTVVIGIVAHSGRAAPGLPGFAVAAVHRDVSLLGVVLLVVHVATLVLDPFARLGLLDAVVPFGAGYRPLWVGLGTCAADLMLVLVITSLLRRHLGARNWRRVHWVAYGAWPLAVAHALGSGSDVATGWMRAVALACAGAVLLAVGWRCARFLLGRGGSAGPGAGGLAPDRRLMPPPYQPPRQRDSPARDREEWTR